MNEETKIATTLAIYSGGIGALLPDLKIMKRVHLSEYINTIVFQWNYWHQDIVKILLELFTNWKFEKEGEIGKFPFLDIEHVEITSCKMSKENKKILISALKFKKEMNKSIEENKEVDRRTWLKTVSSNFGDKSSSLTQMLKIQMKNSYILLCSNGEINCISFEALELCFDHTLQLFYSDENLYIFDIVESTKIKNADLLDSDHFITKRFEELLLSIDSENLLGDKSFFAIFNNGFENICIDNMEFIAFPSFREVKWIEYKTEILDNEDIALLKEMWDGTTYFISEPQKSSYDPFRHIVHCTGGNKVIKKASSLHPQTKIFLEIKNVDPSIIESSLETLFTLPIFSFMRCGSLNLENLTKIDAKIMMRMLSNNYLSQFSINWYTINKSFLLTPDRRQNLIEYFDEGEKLHKTFRVNHSGECVMPKMLF
jgi:hypothetical protein